MSHKAVSTTWDANNDSKLIELLAQSLSNKAIAKRLKCTEEAVVERLMQLVKEQEAASKQDSADDSATDADVDADATASDAEAPPPPKHTPRPPKQTKAAKAKKAATNNKDKPPKKKPTKKKSAAVDSSVDPNDLTAQQVAEQMCVYLKLNHLPPHPYKPHGQSFIKALHGCKKLKLLPSNLVEKYSGSTELVAALTAAVKKRHDARKSAAAPRRLAFANALVNDSKWIQEMKNSFSLEQIRTKLIAYVKECHQRWPHAVHIEHRELLHSFWLDYSSQHKCGDIFESEVQDDACTVLLDLITQQRKDALSEEELKEVEEVDRWLYPFSYSSGRLHKLLNTLMGDTEEGEDFSSITSGANLSNMKHQQLLQKLGEQQAINMFGTFIGDYFLFVVQNKQLFEDSRADLATHVPKLQEFMKEQHPDIFDSSMEEAYAAFYTPPIPVFQLCVRVTREMMGYVDGAAASDNKRKREDDEDVAGEDETDIPVPKKQKPSDPPQTFTLLVVSNESKLLLIPDDKIDDAARAALSDDEVELSFDALSALCASRAEWPKQTPFNVTVSHTYQITMEADQYKQLFVTEEEQAAADEADVEMPSTDDAEKQNSSTEVEVKEVKDSGLPPLRSVDDLTDDWFKHWLSFHIKRDIGTGGKPSLERSEDEGIYSDAGIERLSLAVYDAISDLHLSCDHGMDIMETAEAKLKEYIDRMWPSAMEDVPAKQEVAEAEAGPQPIEVEPESEETTVAVAVAKPVEVSKSDSDSDATPKAPPAPAPAAKAPVVAKSTSKLAVAARAFLYSDSDSD